MKKISTFFKEVVFLIAFIRDSWSLLKNKAEQEETFEKANT